MSIGVPFESPIVWWKRLVGPLTPAPRERFVHRDPREPGREPRPLLELIEVRERVDVRLLHHVFGFGLVADDGARDAVHALVVPAHQDFEQRSVAAAYAVDDLRVSGRGRKVERHRCPIRVLRCRGRCNLATCHLFTRRDLHSTAAAGSSRGYGRAAGGHSCVRSVHASVSPSPSSRLPASRQRPSSPRAHTPSAISIRHNAFDKTISRHAEELFADGVATFRDDTFGDEHFWGDTLKLHQAIEGAQFGGVGPGVSPAVALQVGLKVDVDRRAATRFWMALKRGT